MANFRNVPSDHAMHAIGTDSFPATEVESRDVNFNPDNQPDETGKVLDPYTERETFSTDHGILPPTTPSDPLMRKAYTMPMTGDNSLQGLDQNASRGYKMASDIFGTGMDRSWSASPGSASVPSSPKNTFQNFDVGNEASSKGAPRSFKITEIPPSPNGSSDDQSGASAAGRRARESNGNPLTGQGFNPENAKTGKRYFEGSNANQKLW